MSPFGIAILAAVFSAAGSYASPHAFSTGFTRAVGVAALLSLGAAVAGLFVPGRRGSAVEPPGASQQAGPVRPRELQVAGQDEAA